MPARTLSCEGGGLWDSTLIKEGNGCQRERWAAKGMDYEILHTGTKHYYKGVISLSVLKNLERKLEKKSLKRTISASGGLRLLQYGWWDPTMVLEQSEIFFCKSVEISLYQTCLIKIKKNKKIKIKKIKKKTSKESLKNDNIYRR